jgi:hypothetical protein
MVAIRRIVNIAALVCVGAGAPAAAQDNPRLGLNFGYPSIGLTWHATKRVAVRPEFSFSLGSSSATSGSGVEGSEADNWGVGIGVSALFYVADWDGVRAYVAPRLSFNTSKTSSVTSISSSKAENTSDGWDLGALFGVQYSFTRRLAAFGEVGFSYADRHSEYSGLSSLVSKTDSWGFGPRTAIGMIFYF